jgi:methylase of polypeptide subunit release factors
MEPARDASEVRALRTLREVLTRACYEDSVVAEARKLGRLLPPEEVHAGLRARYRSSALEPLISLLTLDDRVSCPEAQQALEPVTLEELEELGLLEREGTYVRSRIRAIVHQGLLLFGDGGDWDHPDVVSALYGSPSALLASLTPRAPKRSALDLGTGAGVQALLASRHCERVIGTDVNPRALAFAQLGAQANGIENVQWRQGSWLEPVAGERFDLIVGNLPYVVSPDTEFTFRDAGRPADEVMALLCAELPEHLEEGGLAILLHEWPQETKEDWRILSEGRFQAPGCDTILVCLAGLDPFDHAVGWHSLPARVLGREELKRGVTRWYAHSRQSGTGALGFGALILRRRAGGTPWMVEARSHTAPGAGAARQLQRLIEGNDLLAAGEDVLERRFVVPAGFSVSQRFVRREERWVGRAAMVTVPDELGLGAAIDPEALDVVFRCDGRTELASLVHGDGEQRAVAVEAVRELLANGLLEIC